jgi:hypothetical protein
VSTEPVRGSRRAATGLRSFRNGTTANTAHQMPEALNAIRASNASSRNAKLSTNMAANNSPPPIYATAQPTEDTRSRSSGADRSGSSELNTTLAQV